MQGREHLVVGTVAIGAVVWGAHALGQSLEPAQVAAGIVLAGVGSLAPDIDHSQSMISSSVPASILGLGVLMAGGAPAMKLMAARDGMWSAVFSSIGQLAAPFVPLGVLFIMLALAMLFAARMVRGQFRHRGEMHSFTLAGAGAIMGLLVCAVFHLAAWVGLAFGFGWAMHLVADATTPAGLEEPLWPFDVAGVALGRGPAAVSLALVVVLGLAGWVHVSGAMLDARAPRAASVPTRVVGNVPLARQRLAEASPEIEASLASPDAPTIGVVGSNTTYTWDRLQQTTAGAVTVRKITLTLDSAGNIVGVDQR